MGLLGRLTGLESPYEEEQRRIKREEREKEQLKEKQSAYLKKHEYSEMSTKQKLKLVLPQVKYDLKRAERGDAASQHEIGSIFYFGKDGVVKDEQEALKWYKLAGEQKHKLAIGFIIVLESDPVEVLRWRKFATEVYDSDPKYQSESAENLYQIGLMYDQGLGVEKDSDEADKWYKLAADRGHRGAQRALRIVGFKCPKCANFMPLRDLRCECGSELSEVMGKKTVAAGLTFYGNSADIRYEERDTGYIPGCLKCTKVIESCHCSKCNTSYPRRGNYGYFGGR